MGQTRRDVRSVRDCTEWGREREKLLDIEEGSLPPAPSLPADCRGIEGEIGVRGGQRLGVRCTAEGEGEQHRNHSVGIAGSGGAICVPAE